MMKTRLVLISFALGLGLSLALLWLLDSQAMPTVAAAVPSPSTWPGVNSADGSVVQATTSAYTGTSVRPHARLHDAPPPATPSEPDAVTHHRFKQALPDQALSDLPLRFVANAGQADPAVRFTVKGAGHTFFFTEKEIVFSASSHQLPVTAQALRHRPTSMPHPHPRTRNSQFATRNSSVVRLSFPGANPHPTVEGLSPMSGVANFFLGNDPARWRANLPTYEAVAYRDLYPGVDLVYRGTAGHLKSEFLVAPGADPAVIHMVYGGVEALHLREDGTLVLQTPLGELTEFAPLIYQEVDGVRREIPGGYVLRGVAGGQDVLSQQVSFQVGDHDPALPLVIDPELAYSSYLGGSDEFDGGSAIAVDGAGNIYVTGTTDSTDFPTTTNAIQPGYGGGEYWRDVFVTQIINAGGIYTYGYSSYLGGSDSDTGWAIVVNGAGNIYVTGATRSTDFPTTTNAIQPGYGGGEWDAFVTQIVNARGAYTLAYSTYLGEGGGDWGNDITVDSACNIYVTGWTNSTDFPTTTNAIQPGYGGGDWDVFVTQIISARGAYTYGYSSYLGGADGEIVYDIIVDGVGNVYVTGGTSSTDFPTTTNAIQPSYGGGGDAFVTQIISASGAYTYGYSSYLGRADSDVGGGIAVDGVDNVYVTGGTRSNDFLTTTNAIQPRYGGGWRDAFVTQIISTGGVYTYSYFSYLGGSDSDGGSGITVDGAGKVYVIGGTNSTDFPTTTNAIQPGYGGGEWDDVFVTQIISASGAYTYGYSTYLGGSGYDLIWPAGVAVDRAGNVYVTGETRSTNLLTTTNAIQPVHAGGEWDAFVVKISPAGLAIHKTVTPDTVAPGQAITYTLTYVNGSQMTVGDVLITDVVPVTLTNVSFTSSGAQVTPTGSVSYIWQVEDLLPGAGGVIVIVGIVSPSVRGVFSLTNRATITTTDVSYVDENPDNNVSVVRSTIEGTGPCRLYLPLIVRQFS